MFSICQTLCGSWKYSGNQETQSLVLLQILVEHSVLRINGNQTFPLGLTNSQIIR